MKYYSESLDKLFDTKEELERAETSCCDDAEFFDTCKQILNNAELAAKSMIERASNSAQIILEDAKNDVQQLISEYELHKQHKPCTDKKVTASTEIPTIKDSILRYIHNKD